MSSAMLAFDTYKYANRLKAAGFTEIQAEAQTAALTEAMDAHVQNLATKDDLRLLSVELNGKIDSLESRLRGEMNRLGVELRGEMSTSRAEVRGEIEKLRSEIAPLRWMIAPTAISLVATVVGVSALLVKNFS
jgi:hypothetical protein